jgi:cell division protein FtsQ
MKPIWKYILIGFFTMLVISYIVFSLWRFSGREKTIVCQNLEIIFADSSNSQLVTQTDVAHILERNDLNPLGKTIKDIRTESIEEILHKNPMIKSVECYLAPTGAVTIRISQRCPKFRVVGWGSYYIDIDRKTMPVSKNHAAYVPVVSGRVTVSMATGEMFDFVTYLANDPFWNAQIEQIYVCDDMKIELIPRVGDAIIVLGTLDNYQSKLEKLYKLYQKGFNVVGWNKYKTIDLQYKDQVVCSRIDQQSAQTKIVSEEKKDSIIASKL